MSVYVDALERRGEREGFRWHTSCRMYADTLAELHAMADRIGMWRAWFQDDAGDPHYELVPARRAMAVEAGAVEHTREQREQYLRRRNAAAAGQASLFGGAQ